MRRIVFVMFACVALIAACDDGAPPAQPSAVPTERPLPPRVSLSPEPQGVGLADPTFTALPGAQAYHGRLGGTVYQIEVPDDWNGRLVLYMHGFQGLAPEAEVQQPGIRAYLIGNGFAWGASSYSSTALIPGRAADETAALWDEFVGRFGRPSYTYVTGHSMGGAASHIAAERYADRYDGVLGLCGFAGQNAISEIIGDYLFAGAYIAGVTQDEFDTLPIDQIINGRIKPALQESTAHQAWVDILLDMTGGERAHDREGFELEELTNWDRAQILVATGLSYNDGREYNLGPLSGASRQDFNQAVVRKTPAQPDQLESFNEGNEITGDLQVKMLTLHTTGDWQVPIDQQQILRQRVDAAGRGDLLVQRVIRAAGHCDFLDSEWEQGLEDLIAWVERDETPAGEDVLVADLRQSGAAFTRAPRFGSSQADAVAGAGERVTARGRVTLNGAPLTYAFLWAEIEAGGLRRLCAFGGPSPSSDGRYERTIVSETEMAGCGAADRRIRIGASTGGRIYFSSNSVAWPPAGGDVSLDVDLTDADAMRPADDVTPVYGNVFDASGDRMPPSTKIEAFIGETLCGVIGVPATVLQFQNPDTYDILVAGPSVPGCEQGATITFRVNGEPVLQTATNDVEGDGVALDLTLR